MLDTTRDWFFLSPEEISRSQTGDKHLEAYKDDYTKMNASARQLNDWRKALDYSQDWKWSSAASRRWARRGEQLRGAARVAAHHVREHQNHGRGASSCLARRTTTSS